MATNRSHSDAQDVMELMAAADIMPTPANYEFWYAYIRKANPELVAAADQLLANHRIIPPSTMAELRNRFSSVEPLQDLERIVDVTYDQIGKVMQLLGTADGDARIFQNVLERGKGGLENSDMVSDHKALIAHMLQATTAMVDRTQRLESQLQQYAEEVVALRSDLDKARTESRTDVLTGLPNRAAFMLHLENQAARALADRKPISVLFCDIDHFKSFNDKWGHLIGDEVLRLVAQCLEQLVSGLGYAARYGGEEFVIALPHKDVSAASDIADQMRDFIASKTLRARHSQENIGKITLSMGVAQLRWDDTVDNLLERADRALYLAKQEGRNQVCDETMLEEPQTIAVSA